MKRELWLMALLLSAAPAMADEPRITLKKELVPAARSTVKENELYINAQIDGQGCRILNRANKRGLRLEYSISEDCHKQISSEKQTAIRERILAALFEAGAFDGVSEFDLSFSNHGEQGKFECDLIRYASASPQWPPLLNRLEISPMAFDFFAWSNFPENFQEDFGKFIRASGLLADYEQFFLGHGYKLTGMHLSASNVTHLKFLELEERKCLAPLPVAERVPTFIDLELEFQSVGSSVATQPGKR